MARHEETGGNKDGEASSISTIAERLELRHADRGKYILLRVCTGDH